MWVEGRPKQKAGDQARADFVKHLEQLEALYACYGHGANSDRRYIDARFINEQIEKSRVLQDISRLFAISKGWR